MRMIKSRYFSCYIKATEEELDNILECLSAIQNVHNASYWGAVGYMFRLGAERATEDIQDKSRREEVQRSLLKHKLLLTIRKESQRDDEIRKGMTELGIERIVSAAKADGLDEKRVRSILEGVRAEMPFTSMAAQWLEDFFSDYKKHSTDEVRDAAVKDGLLPMKDDPSHEKKWASMKVVASRQGLSSGEWGSWQKKLL